MNKTKLKEDFGNSLVFKFLLNKIANPVNIFRVKRFNLVISFYLLFELL